MRYQQSLEPSLTELREFSTLAWREFSAYSPQGRRASYVFGAGVFLVGLPVTSLGLYGIYRGLGALSLGPAEPVPIIVWVVFSAGVVIGAFLLGVAAAMKRRSMRVPRFTAAEIEAANRANGHHIPIPRGSRTV